MVFSAWRHEYGYNVEAQIELAQSHSRWVMDARYYTSVSSWVHRATMRRLSFGLLAVCVTVPS